MLICNKKSSSTLCKVSLCDAHGCCRCLNSYGHLVEADTVCTLPVSRTIDDMVRDGKAAEAKISGIPAPQLQLPESQVATSESQAAHIGTERHVNGMNGTRALISIPPERYVIEALHMHINMVDKHVSHTIVLAHQLGIDLRQHLEALQLGRPKSTSWGIGVGLQILRRRREVLAPFNTAANKELYDALMQRFKLLRRLLRFCRLIHPSAAQIDKFKVNLKAFGELLLEKWGAGGKSGCGIKIEDTRTRYPWRFYDHGLICHGA